MAAKKTEKKKTFEEMLAELEGIIARMESGMSSPLETLLKDYEEGTRLLDVLEEELAQAQQKLTILRRQEDGTEQEEPLEDGE